MSLIKRFNPYDLPEETLHAIATGRERVLEQILGIISRNAEGGRVQHLQIIAPRGYGKSFLMRMVQSALKARVKEGLPAILALLPEEQHNVDAPSRLLNEIQRLLEGRPASNLLGGAFTESDEAWDQAVAALDASIAARLPEGRGIAVAIVENFDRLIFEVFRDDQDQSRLRALMDRPGGRLMLLATATRQADADYEKRLFHATRPMELEPWKEEFCLTFFEKLRAHREKGEMSPRLQAKARAIAHFIGGSPRMATVLAEVLDSNDSLRVAEVLEELVDELTPYYKHRIESLSRRARTLLDALLRMGEPRTQSEIAARLGTVQARIAEPFNELRARSEVVGVKAQHSAEMLYHVGDRLMAYYYRRRHLNPGESTSLLEGIIEFLELYYTPEERQSEAERLRAMGRTKDAAVFDRLAKANTAPSAGGTGPEAGWLDELRKQLVALRDAGQLDDAVAFCQQAVRRAEESGDQRAHARSRRFLGWLLNAKGRYQEAEETLRRSIDLAAQIGDLREQASSSRILSWTFRDLERRVEEEETLRRALDLAAQASDLREQAESSRHLGYTLGQQGRHAEAEGTLRRAVELAAQAGDLREQAESSRLLGYTLRELRRHTEEEEMLRHAVELTAQAGDLREQAEASRLLGYTLGQMGRHEEAKETLRRAVELAERSGDAESIAWARFDYLREVVSAKDDPAIVMTWLSVCATPAMVSTNSDQPDYTRWFNDVAAAALRSGQFDAFWPTVAVLPLKAWRVDLGQAALAREVASASEAHGRAAAYALAAQAIEVLAQDASMRKAREGLAGPEPISFLRGIISRLAWQVTDPALLRDIAALLEQRLPSETATERAILDARARLLENPNDPAAVERLDPDVVMGLEPVFREAFERVLKTPPLQDTRERKPRGKKRDRR
jgi:tetratricopeptide (TPR) repeat protein